MRLERWSVVNSGNPYIPPEHQPMLLRGRVYDNPNFEDGTIVVTSAVASASGRDVTTASGSVYHLGMPDFDYLRWLNQQGIAYDPCQPVKIRKVGLS